MQFGHLPLPRNEPKQNLLSNATIAEEIFRKSLNTSYIGQMSGQKDVPSLIEGDSLFAIPEQPSNIKRKRIDFSRFKGEVMRETVISAEDMQYMYVRSLSHGGKEQIQAGGCSGGCNQQGGRKKCLLELVNESTLQLYTQGEDRFDCLLASINFDTITVDIQFENIPDNRQIALVAPNFRIVLEHDKRRIVDHWHDEICKMQAQSKGKELKLTKLLSIEAFYKERFETEDFFTKNCETGDVILFQDDHFFAKAQRFFTRSNFDHVGMVVKDTRYGILIFQANSGSGVGLTPWRSVIRYGWYRSIPKSFSSKLKVKRDSVFNEKVEKFVMENLRKNYHISFAKIMAHESVIRPVGGAKKNSTEDENDESGFFCSELVATIYKELGLLTRDHESSNYQPACKFYPKDFSERSGRKLDMGELSPEYAIHFDPALLKLNYRGLIRDD